MSAMEQSGYDMLCHQVSHIGDWIPNMALISDGAFKSCCHVGGLFVTLGWCSQKVVLCNLEFSLDGGCIKQAWVLLFPLLPGSGCDYLL